MHFGKFLSTVMFCVLFVSNNSFACDKALGTGFCWPLGRQHTRVSTPFLEKGSDHGGTYLRGEYHIGVDIAAPEGSTVWPIADGTVIHLSYGGWTNGSTANYALLVRHTLTDGSHFIALYGHLIIPAKKWERGDKVHINQPIGKVGDWRFGDHLHLSIWPNKKDTPGGNYGKDIWAHYPNTYGQSDPINFLNTHHPKRLFFEKEELKVASFPGAEDIAWYPRDKECDEAERWFKLKNNGEVENEINQDSACSIVNQKRQEEADRIYQAKLQAQEEAYRQELEARNNRPWWQKVVDFIIDLLKIHHTNAQEIDDELKNLVVYRTITIYTDNSGNIVDGDVGVRSGGDYYAGYYPNYTSNGTGATEHSQPGESDHPGYVHNVSMDDTEMSPAGGDNYHGSWTFYHGEVPTVNVRVRLKNKTNLKIGRNDVTIKWFESPNHTFNPNHDHHFATDHNKKSIGPFKHHSHDDELVERKRNLN